MPDAGIHDGNPAGCAEAVRSFLSTMSTGRVEAHVMDG